MVLLTSGLMALWGWTPRTTYRTEGLPLGSRVQTSLKGGSAARGNHTGTQVKAERVEAMKAMDSFKKPRTGKQRGTETRATVGAYT